MAELHEFWATPEKRRLVQKRIAEQEISITFTEGNIEAAKIKGRYGLLKQLEKTLETKQQTLANARALLARIEEALA